MDQCAMTDLCHNAVLYIDNKGFVYCQAHGRDRRAYGTPCRKLRPHELRRLQRGQTISY